MTEVDRGVAIDSRMYVWARIDADPAMGAGRMTIDGTASGAGRVALDSIVDGRSLDAGVGVDDGRTTDDSGVAGVAVTARIVDGTMTSPTIGIGMTGMDASLLMDGL